ncbi:MAG: universal stress protein [Comamonadaceae bacterium]|jgi:nucleotide-binding universal stress UspA family protein|nr:universal stress protein [Comamonadaceae bacterium]
MKIVLAVDGSPFTKRMLSYLAAHEELVGADHDFVAVNVSRRVSPAVAAFVHPEVLQRYYADDAEAVLGPVRAFARMQGWRLSEQHAVGRPGDALAEIVQAQQPDLLVMGSHGHGAIAGVLLGSVASRLLALTTVPVLLIR